VADVTPVTAYTPMSPGLLREMLESVPLSRRVPVLMAIFDMRGSELAAIGGVAREKIYHYRNASLQWPEDVALAIAEHFQLPIPLLFGDHLSCARRRIHGWSLEQRRHHQEHIYGPDFMPVPLRDLD
jgi:hypothetical protein